MSVDDPLETGVTVGNLPDADTETRRGPRPVAHGAAVQAHLDDVDLDLGFAVDGASLDREATTYDAVLAYWRENVGDRDREPYPVAEFDSDRFDWLPDARHGRRYRLELTSSSWKAGTGEGDDYRPYYKYDVKLREVDDDGDTHDPPLSCHLKIMPQYDDLVYKDGNHLKLPYGEGTRVTCQTTWAESAGELETRMLDVLEAAVGADRDRLELARNDDSRRLGKAEAHVRFKIGKKNQLIETLEQTKQLIAYGGASEVEAHQQRQREGWLEALVDADRWELLGFAETEYNIEAKIYQTADWADKNPDDYAYHPKFEVSFAGVNGNGKLPHVDDWDEILGNLRSIVSSHLDWAAVGRDHLVADDFFDGPRVAEYEYTHPVNRREQLRRRYEDVATQIYREATKANTRAVYDILRVLAEEDGASYDVLEARTGLARSSVRRHVRRLDDRGVVDRISNPVHVVFPGLEALDRASEILRKVMPGDSIDDMNERAENRRERRERADWSDRVPAGHQEAGDDDQEASDGPGDEDSAVDGAVDGTPRDTDDDRETSDATSTTESSSDRNTWAYFGDLDLRPHQLANALEREYLDGDDVRVRTNAGDWVE